MKLLQVVLASLLLNYPLAFAYYPAWPPFKQGTYRYLDLKPVSEKDVPSFIKDHSNLDEGKGIPHDRVKEEFAEWLTH